MGYNLMAEPSTGIDWYAVAESIISISAIVIGILWTVKQVGKQFRNSLKLQKQNSRVEHNRILYEQLRPLVDQYNSDSAALSTYVRLVLNTFQANLANPDISGPVMYRYQELADYQTAFDETIARVHWWIETNGIISRSLPVFQIAISSELHELRREQNHLFASVMLLLPVDLENGETYTPDLTAEKVDSFEKVAEAWFVPENSIGGYVMDLTIAMQNELLGELYDRRVPPRTQIKNRRPVIDVRSDQDARDLIKYFQENTEFGKIERDFLRSSS